MNNEKAWFEWQDKIFYKQDYFPDEIWINNEVMVQLNITSQCPLSCEFCYLRGQYGSVNLSFLKIEEIWAKNLKKYWEEKGIEYRVNLTGGDIFEYPDLTRIISFLEKEESIVAVDPLINTFWDEKYKDLLEKIVEKISYIGFNLSVVTESDIEWAEENGKFALLKYPLYKGDHKKETHKLKYLLESFNNTILSFDIIIPQKNARSLAKNTYLNNIHGMVQEAKSVLEQMRVSEERVLLLNCILEREINKRTYLCGVGIQNIYLMPNGEIVPCSRYPHLKTGFTIENFDLIQYFEKFNPLISNTCLFENKYFSKFWPESENPLSWIKAQQT